MINQITIVSGDDSVTMTRYDRRMYFLNDVDWGQLTGSHNTYSYYNQVGASIVSTAIGTRDIQITGYVVEDDEQDTFKSRCDFLDTFISPLRDCVLYYGSYKIGFRPDSSVAWSRTFRENNLKHRKFSIQGTCAYPLFELATSQSQSFENIAKAFRFPHYLGTSPDTTTVDNMKGPFYLGVKIDTIAIDVENVGGFAAGVDLELAFTGVTTNPKVYNLTTGEYVGLAYTMQNGDILNISTRPGNKSMVLTRDGATSNVIKYRDVGMSWWQLQPGTNNLSLAASDGNVGNILASISFTPLYQEVE